MKVEGQNASNGYLNPGPGPFDGASSVVWDGGGSDFTGNSGYDTNPSFGMQDYGLDYGLGGMFSSEGANNVYSTYPMDMSGFNPTANDTDYEKLREYTYPTQQFSDSTAGKGLKTLGSLAGFGPQINAANTALHGFNDPGKTAGGLFGNIVQSGLLAGLGPVGMGANLVSNLSGYNLGNLMANGQGNSQGAYSQAQPGGQPANSGGNRNDSGASFSLSDLVSGLGGGAAYLMGGLNSGKIANNLTGMYSQNSPYAQQMKKELLRRDAASGRGSQYGAREVELQAKLAAMANQSAKSQLEARQQQMNDYGHIAQGIGGLGKLYSSYNQSQEKQGKPDFLTGIGNMWNDLFKPGDNSPKTLSYFYGD